MASRDGNSAWIIRERGFSAKKTEVLGSKLLIGNGYMGYRGTLEEFGKERLVACTLAGIYDRYRDSWREPVNAPNALFVQVSVRGRRLDPVDREPLEHHQELDIRQGLHRRDTRFALPGGGSIRVISERFASLDNPHLLCMHYSLEADRNVVATLLTGINGDVWDINGPHFVHQRGAAKRDVLTLDARTNEGKRVYVAEAVDGLDAKFRVRRRGRLLARQYELRLKKGRRVEFEKVVAVFTSADPRGSLATAVRTCERVRALGYERLRAESARRWAERWADCDVSVEGDAVAQRALRYSIYQLIAIAPAHTDRASIPARGLSGQVYKGAIFWDTEMFMLPFFDFTQPSIARNLVRYRVHTLAGARRKAASLGYEGAFYAWESQETGDEACTLFNVTDVITNRPVRTYFADKQIHISADVAYGIWHYYRTSGDESILIDGGAEVMLECARFFRSWSYHKTDRRRYELLDVTGPDEYHERVHNNAYTNAMARYTVGAALAAANVIRRNHPARFRQLVAKLGLRADLKDVRDLYTRLYVPAPDPKTRVIEQFDGYCRLREVGVAQLKQQLLDPREYLGGGQGLATTTRVIKQADVVAMLNVLGSDYDNRTKQANWEFYEPRTEHGSSLSACVYAMVAASIGKIDWAYQYFLKTATIDLTGDAKQYVGSLYIGGTHPAANGGAWMAAVLGFGGLATDGQTLTLMPRLPRRWKSLSFRIAFHGQRLSVCVRGRAVRVTADTGNNTSVRVRIGNQTAHCAPGAAVTGSIGRLSSPGQRLMPLSA